MVRLSITLLCLSVAISDTVSGASSDLSRLFAYKEGDRYFLSADDGILRVVDLEETNPEWRFDAERDVRFRLFTRKNPNNFQDIAYDDINSLLESNYNHSKATKIFCHGHGGNGTDVGSTHMRQAFLREYDANVITVDWSLGAAAPYTTAVTYVRPVGVFLGKMVDWLISSGSKLDNFHLAGFSLGAHAVGNAGRSIVAGKLPYLMVLDPAMPLWGSGSQRVRPTDARYVEVIHTNLNGYGLKEPVGHNDFYPNGGMTMPGCSPTDVGCSHSRSYRYYAESLDNTRFMAIQCESLDEVTKNGCVNPISRLHMGGGSPKQARGLFYLTTGADPPYYEN